MSIYIASARCPRCQQNLRCDGRTFYHRGGSAPVGGGGAWMLPIGDACEQADALRKTNPDTLALTAYFRGAP